MPSVECAEEFEMLESIYKEVKIEDTAQGESTVSMVMHPATAGDTESRYVTITIVFRISAAYPDELPKIELHNPRGVSEEQLNSLYEQLVKTSEELIGSSMLYQLIAMVQDFLTSNNRPSSECPICLTCFSDFDVFYTPACYHHFHSRCLGIYLQNVVTTYNNDNENSRSVVTPSSEIPKLCPVCRVELDANVDIEKLLSAPPASEDTDELPPNLTLPAPDEKLQQLFNKQRDQGGIIDLTDTCKRLTLVISQPTPQPSTVEATASVPELQNSSAAQPAPTQTRTIPGRQEPKSHHYHRHASGRRGTGGGSSGHGHGHSVYGHRYHHGHTHVRNTQTHAHGSSATQDGHGHNCSVHPHTSTRGGGSSNRDREPRKPCSSTGTGTLTKEMKAPITHFHTARTNSSEERSVAAGEGHGSGHHAHHPRRRPK